MGRDHPLRAKDCAPDGDGRFPARTLAPARTTAVAARQATAESR